MEFRYDDGTERRRVRLIASDDGYEVRIGEQRYQVRHGALGGAWIEYWIDGVYHRAAVAAEGAARWTRVHGRVQQAELVRNRRRQRASGAGQDTLEATMPGQIVAVPVRAGEAVVRGQTLVVMEAMKMELRVAAPHDGTVKQVLVESGDTVDRGQTLIALE